MSQLWKHDLKAVKGHSHLIGLDEAGRGPLAGPVVAAAVALRHGFFLKASHRKNTATFDASKKVPEPRRLELFEWLNKARSQGRLDYSCAAASVEEIETENIFPATTLAMKRAIAGLPEDLRPKATTDDLPLFQPKATSKPPPSLILLDGKPMKKLGHPHRAIVQGDGTSLSIAMASILAKTLRDQLMVKLDEDFPQYGFVKHKGYGTPQHLEALRHHGPCHHHRPRFLRNLDI